MERFKISSPVPKRQLNLRFLSDACWLTSPIALTYPVIPNQRLKGRGDSIWTVPRLILIVAVVGLFRPLSLFMFFKRFELTNSVKGICEGLFRPHCTLKKLDRIEN